MILPFNIDHAMTAGLLMRSFERDATDRRDVVKEDIKLIAQAICVSITHIMTEDRRTLAKYVQRLNAAGESAIQTVLLVEGFDAAWFNNGQRGLPGT